MEFILPELGGIAALWNTLFDEVEALELSWEMGEHCLKLY